MKLLLKSLVLFLGLAAASPALAFSYSCADWDDSESEDAFWREATRATIADCIQDMGFAMGFSVKDRDFHGQTPLKIAAQYASDPDVITALLQAGADVNARDAFGLTPLHSAAILNPNVNITTILIKAGADVNARNVDGITPLHWAAQFTENPQVVAALLEAGADGSLRDRPWEKTPFDYGKNNRAIEKILTSFGL